MADVTITFTCPGKPSAPHHIFITYDESIKKYVITIVWYDKEGNLISFKHYTTFADSLEEAIRIAKEYVREHICSGAVFSEEAE